MTGCAAQRKIDWPPAGMQTGIRNETSDPGMDRWSWLNRRQTPHQGVLTF